MNTPVLFLSIGYMFITALLLIALIYSRFHWILKSGLIIASLLFTALFMHGYVAALGYSVIAPTPERFRFISSLIREPSASDAGAVYVWLVDLAGRHEPRALELPYSKQTRAMMETAKKRQQSGDTVYMGKKDKGQGKKGANNYPTTSQNPGKKTDHPNDGISVEIEGGNDLDFINIPDELPAKNVEG